MVGVLRKDPDHGASSRKSVLWCSKEIEGGSVEIDIAEVRSKPRKDPVESFTRERGYSGSE